MLHRLLYEGISLVEKERIQTFVLDAREVLAVRKGSTKPTSAARSVRRES